MCRQTTRYSANSDADMQRTSNRNSSAVPSHSNNVDLNFRQKGAFAALLAIREHGLTLSEFITQATISYPTYADLLNRTISPAEFSAQIEQSSSADNEELVDKALGIVLRKLGEEVNELVKQSNKHEHDEDYPLLLANRIIHSNDNSTCLGRIVGHIRSSESSAKCTPREGIDAGPPSPITIVEVDEIECEDDPINIRMGPILPAESSPFTRQVCLKTLSSEITIAQHIGFHTGDTRGS